MEPSNCSQGWPAAAVAKGQKLHVSCVDPKRESKTGVDSEEGEQWHVATYSPVPHCFADCCLDVADRGYSAVGESTSDSAVASLEVVVANSPNVEPLQETF